MHGRRGPHAVLQRFHQVKNCRNAAPMAPNNRGIPNPLQGDKEAQQQEMPRVSIVLFPDPHQFVSCKSYIRIVIVGPLFRKKIQQRRSWLNK
jgi:hypothetical protein